MKTATLKPEPALARQFFADKMMFTTGPVEVHHQIEDEDEINIVDVREAEDYEKGHVPGARNLPQDQWSDISVLSRDQTNVLYCYSQTCHLAAKAAVRFAEQGFPVMEMDGGFEGWKENELPIEK
jgi:rhodanese-related sulfurtransferase